MATDITAYLLLEKDTSKVFIGGREVPLIVELDEGHDRAVWQVRKGSSFQSLSSKFVPSEPAGILLEGIQFLAECELGVKADSLDSLADSLNGYTVNLVLFEGSTCVEQLDHPRLAGLNLVVMSTTP